MRTRWRHNRRWVGALLALALFVMSLPSRGAWLCLNGMECPANCPMLRGAVLSKRNDKTPAPAHCSHCPKPYSASRSISRTPKASCPPAGCIIRANTHPAAALAGGTIIILPLLALPPPVAQRFIGTEEPDSSAYPRPVYSLPPRLARPHLGRAPPSRLI